MLSVDVISGVALNYFGIDVQFVHAKFRDSRFSSGRIIRLWLAGPVLHTFVQYLIAFCSRPETPSDVISGTDVE